MIELEAHAQGTVVPVKAQAGARRTGISGVRGGRLWITVSQPPEKGKANAAIIAVLAEALRIPRSQIELLSGQTSRHKRFLVRAVNSAELSRRLADVAGAA